MGSIEAVLSLDLEENDFLYRIRRGSRIVYVSVLHEDIIPHGCRTDGSRVLSNLRRVPKWEEHWKTLTVRKGSHGVNSTPDEFTPHALNLKALNIHLPKFFNILDLIPVSRISDRISRVRFEDETWILKIARFKHEIPALQREISIYSTLALLNFPLAPKFVGFAYEEVKDRTIGFLMEDISGRTPNIEDLEDCKKTVRLLHLFGIIHGDLNKYNFLMTESGAKVFDFEVSTAQEDADPAAADDEMRALADKFRDESGIGKR
ncbi:hypothetical protein PRK78_005814 [Emydomyces testavorans]|uniref:non-specific serine/threonine protein kinase n=1 Tax=Emydomyces testavorans TaxID=2070801 RepID=A0AAF0IMZ5_9EURO|nr:hypothetical protein PRK78_005814 [Emydomyces testavorans]